MRRSPLLLALTLSAAPCGLSAQQVPEGVHKDARGPVEMCGLVGRDALDLMGKAKRSAELKPIETASDRFELFQNAAATYQLVVTQPSEPAYPAVTCRRLYVENGATYMNRQMRCDADRQACDALFLEFQALDAALTREIKGR